MLKRRLILPAVSIGGILIALYVAFLLVRAIPNLPPEYPPPIPSYENFVAGEGIIETSSLNISIGVPYGEIVEKIFVKEGDRVKKGDPLFSLDRQERLAEVEEARANVLTMLADYSRQINMPRQEEVWPLEKQLLVAKAELEDQQKQLELYERVKDKRAISEDMINQRRYAVDKAIANYEVKQKDLFLKEAGAWQFDLDISKANIEVAKAKLAIAEIALARSTIRAPIDGEVLRIGVRVGQYAPIGDPDPPNMLFGAVKNLRIRVDVDETEAWRVRKGAKATAYVRGNSSIKFPLDFEYIEPYVVPKRALSGDARELVDTRVLQVIYQFDPKDMHVYVGQMVDIYIEAKTNGKPARGKVL
ncbi:MAG: biotin/lipoyl-binding protein [Rhabdochlamydiaceae bacterium]|nr:biotin/lipoyl-binding protein [Candidatus Amphrikana amoebophyrae]